MKTLCPAFPFVSQAVPLCKIKTMPFEIELLVLTGG